MGWATDRNHSQSTADLASWGRFATQAAGDRSPLSSGEPSGNPRRMPFPCNVPQANVPEHGNRGPSNRPEETKRERAPHQRKGYGPHQAVFPLSRGVIEAIAKPRCLDHPQAVIRSLHTRHARAVLSYCSAGTTGEQGSDPGSGRGSSSARSAAAKSSNQSRPMQ